ncbi:MAG: hypothetical protein AUJ57_00765 [Zetaproteobacteria bacterium CG1_02_53_45]|nr:MAG: hypothetical protein AUJ57_00765 [Zetaproteobacteria bacterium CG1_02_53_45]
MSKYHTLVNHGAAPFQHDEKEKGSYFATIQNEQGREKTVWGVDIPRSLEAAGVEIGDKIELSSGQRKAVQIQVKQPDGTFIEKTVDRVEWITKKQPEITAEVEQKPDTEVTVVEPAIENPEEAKTVETFSVETGPEQDKRAELSDEYETEIAPARDARNTAIEAHEKAFADKWQSLQNEIAKVRGDVSEKLAADNVPQKQRDQVLALETAKLVEQHEVAKHDAALTLDKDIPQPKKWVDFLTEKSVSGDPVVLSLLEEAKESHGAMLTGVSDGKPRGVFLADLSFKADKDVVKYLRGKDEIIMDRGHRLDVKRLDDRDISAALQIASQKFDMDKGLILSGDQAFRTRSAELAGRMGFAVQNMSPEMQKAWDRGQRSATVLKQHERPNLSNGISGEIKKPENVILKVDERIDIQKILESGTGLKAGPSINSLLMNPESYMGAMDAWRNTDSKTLEALTHADINKPDGGLDVREIASSAPELVSGDSFSPLAKELVLVRDAKTLEAKEIANNPEAYKTSQDRVAEDKAQQLQADKQLEKQLLVRNIDEQDQSKDKAKEHSKADPYAFLHEKDKEKQAEATHALSEPEHEQDQGMGF